MRVFGGSTRMRLRPRGFGFLSESAQLRRNAERVRQDAKGRIQLANQEARLAQEQADQARRDLERERTRSAWDRIMSFMRRPLFQARAGRQG